jgi:hypothetical protein
MDRDSSGDFNVYKPEFIGRHANSGKFWQTGLAYDCNHLLCFRCRAGGELAPAAGKLWLEVRHPVDERWLMCRCCVQERRWQPQTKAHVVQVDAI